MAPAERAGERRVGARGGQRLGEARKARRRGGGTPVGPAASCAPPKHVTPHQLSSPHLDVLRQHILDFALLIETG